MEVDFSRLGPALAQKVDEVIRQDYNAKLATAAKRQARAAALRMLHRPLSRDGFGGQTFAIDPVFDALWRECYGRDYTADPDVMRFLRKRNPEIAVQCRGTKEIHVGWLPSSASRRPVGLRAAEKGLALLGVLGVLLFGPAAQAGLTFKPATDWATNLLYQTSAAGVISALGVGTNSGGGSVDTNAVQAYAANMATNALGSAAWTSATNWLANSNTLPLGGSLTAGYVLTVGTGGTNVVATNALAGISFTTKLAADVAVASTTTYTNSPLSVSLPAGTNDWSLKAYLFCASSGGQIKTQLSNTLATAYAGAADWGTGASATPTKNYGWGNTAFTFVAAACAVENACIVYDVFLRTTNACTLTVQFAQQTSSGNATSLKAGSVLQITRQ